MKNLSRERRTLDRDMNSGPPDCEGEAAPTLPWISEKISCFRFSRSFLSYKHIYYIYIYIYIYI
jgi:hypothetical protein